MSSSIDRPAVVIIAHNRPDSLARLLKSLAAAYVPIDTPLIISIDHGGAPSVAQLAYDFAWTAGPKTVRVAEKRLGLKTHTFAACDLAAEDGAFILLEDDLYVSPYFYEFAWAALTEYKMEPRVGGISLYSHRFNETAHRRFTPIDDGTDIFFLQLMAWGHTWTAKQWQGFRTWYEGWSKDCANGAERVNTFNGVAVPRNVRTWPGSSWKKFFNIYMVMNDLYCAMPRISYVTNFTDPGVNNPVGVNYFQVELATSRRRLNLSPFSNSRAVYDGWCEMVPELLGDVLEPLLKTTEVCVDLYGTKNSAEQSAPFMLTTQTTKESVARFGLKLRPREANVLCGIPGDQISLAPTEAVTPSPCNSVLPFHEYLFEYDHLRIRDMTNILGHKLIRRIDQTFGKDF